MKDENNDKLSDAIQLTEEAVVSITHDEDDEPKKVCFLYDTDSPPSRIEKIFGEDYHVKDTYEDHQITLTFILVLTATYWVEGCLVWILISARYYGTAVWNNGPAQFLYFQSVVTIPWTVKIIYGLIIDSVPLFGYKRKSWMVVFGLLAPVSIILAISFAEIFSVHTIMMTLTQVAIAFCDVIADALTVERTEFKSHSVATRLQALAWASRALAAISGLLISAQLQKSGEPEHMLRAYWMYFGISLLIPIFGFFLPEKGGKKKKNEDGADIVETKSEIDPDHPNVGQTYPVKKILYLAFETICRKSIAYPMLFQMILLITPQSGQPLDYFLIYELGFSPVEIGYLAIVANVAFLISIGIVTVQSRKSNQNFSLRTLFLVWTLIGAIVPFISLVVIFGLNRKMGLPDFLFMLGDTIIVKVCGYMITMGSLILFARICPPGIEGFFMTLLTSIYNIGDTIMQVTSSWTVSAFKIDCVEDPDDENALVCDFKNLWILIVVCNLTSLIPLIFIHKVPDEKQLQQIADELNDSSVKNIRPDDDQMIGFYKFCMNIYNRYCQCCLKDDEMETKERGHIQCTSQSDEVEALTTDNIPTAVQMVPDQTQ